MARKVSKKKQKSISKGIEKLVREYKKTGKITTSRATYRPKSLKQAIKIASAIEYGKHKVGRASKKSKKSKK
jgi:hypothetical protein